MKSKISINVKKDFGTYSEGDVIRGVETDSVGVPVDLFWRNRLRDAEIDECVSVERNHAKSSSRTSRPKG